MDKITEDLKERDFKIITFICEDPDGKIVCISYDHRGLVRDISRPVSNISVNEGRGGRMFRPMFDIGRAPEYCED